MYMLVAFLALLAFLGGLVGRVPRMSSVPWEVSKI